MNFIHREALETFYPFVFANFDTQKWQKLFTSQLERMVNLDLALRSLQRYRNPYTVARTMK